MSDREEVHLDVDPMLFMATVVEDQIAILDQIMATAVPTSDLPNMISFGESVSGIASGIAHRKIAEAQAELDRLIEEDTTWRPA